MPKACIRYKVIFCAAPLSDTSLPSIEPKLSISTNEPIVLPMPFSNETTASFRFIPSATPTTRDTMTKAKNELSFRTSIRNSKRHIPRITMSRGMMLLLVAGCWLLVAGCWLLVAGCWLLVTLCFSVLLCVSSYYLLLTTYHLLIQWQPDWHIIP